MEKQMQIIKIFIEPQLTYSSSGIFDHYDYTYYKGPKLSDKELLQEYWGTWDDEELSVEPIGVEGKFIVGRGTDQECVCQIARRYDNVTPPHMAILKEYGVVSW